MQQRPQIPSKVPLIRTKVQPKNPSNQMCTPHRMIGKICPQSNLTITLPHSNTISGLMASMCIPNWRCVCACSHRPFTLACCLHQQTHTLRHPSHRIASQHITSSQFNGWSIIKSWKIIITNRVQLHCPMQRFGRDHFISEPLCKHVRPNCTRICQQRPL